MDYDFGPFIILVVLLLAPAVIVFVVLNIQRLRRSRFHRQRMTKKDNKGTKA